MPRRPAEREGRLEGVNPSSLEGRPSRQHRVETSHRQEAVPAADHSCRALPSVGGAKRRPQFIRVIPDEVELYGAAAAIVLAQIRFRTDYDCLGRVQDDDGVWWWRVSRSELGDQVGLSVQQVKTALKTLGDVVAANHFPPFEDQSLAYRVSTDAKPVDLPEVKSNPVRNGLDLPEVISNQVPGYQQPGTGLDPTSVLIYETWETGGEAPRADAGERTGQTAAGQLSEHPLTLNHWNGHAPGGAVSLDEKRFRDLSASVTVEPPDRKCRTHDSWDGPDCPKCGDDRRAYRGWLETSRRVLADLDLLWNRSSDNDLRRQIASQRRQRIAVFQGMGESWK